MDVLNTVAKTIGLTGLIVGFAYGTEFLIAWYSHNIVEMESFRWRVVGEYGYGSVFLALCNTLIPMLFLFHRFRRSIPWLFGISLVVNFGMWWERFVIIVGGVASIPGVVVGSFAMVFLPEVLRFAAEYRYLMYGAALVVMMLVKPEGLWPAERRRRELHAGEEMAEEAA